MLRSAANGLSEKGGTVAGLVTETLRSELASKPIFGVIKCCDELQEWNERALAVLLPERIREFTYRVEVVTVRYAGEMLVMGGLVGEGASSMAESMRRRLETLALDQQSLELSSSGSLIREVIGAHEDYLRRLLQNAALALDSLQRWWSAFASNAPSGESGAAAISHLKHMHRCIGVSGELEHFLAELNRAFSGFDSD